MKLKLLAHCALEYIDNLFCLFRPNIELLHSWYIFLSTINFNRDLRNCNENKIMKKSYQSNALRIRC